MKKIILYECEICGRKSSDATSILNCEALGRSTGYPVGTIFNNASSRREFYSGITFAVAKCLPTGHFNQMLNWACRDNGGRDSIGKEYCGGFTFLDGESSPDLNNPTCKRLVKFLESKGIVPKIWNGEKAVSLKAFKAAKRKSKKNLQKTSST